MTLCWRFGVDDGRAAGLVRLAVNAEIPAGFQQVEEVLAWRPKKGKGDKEPMTTLKVIATERLSGRKHEFDVTLPTKEFKAMCETVGIKTPRHLKQGPEFISIYSAATERQLDNAARDGDPVVLQDGLTAAVVSQEGDGAVMTEVALTDGGAGGAPFRVMTSNVQEEPAGIIVKLMADGMQIVGTGESAAVRDIIAQLTAASGRFNYQVAPGHNLDDVISEIGRLERRALDVKLIGDRFISLGENISGVTLKSIGEHVSPIPHGRAALFAKEESKYFSGVVPPNDSQNIYTVLLMDQDMTQEQIRTADKEVTAEHQSIVVVTGEELNLMLRDGQIAIILDAEKASDHMRHIRPSRDKSRAIPVENYDIRNAWMAGTGRVIAAMANRVGDPELADPAILNRGPLALKDAAQHNAAVRMAFLAHHGVIVDVPTKAYRPHQVSAHPVVQGFMAEVLREVRDLRAAGADFIADKSDAEAIRDVLAGREDHLKSLVVTAIAAGEVKRAAAQQRAGVPDEIIVQSAIERANDPAKAISAETWPQVMSKIIEDSLHNNGDRVVNHVALNKTISREIRKIEAKGIGSLDEWTEKNIEAAFMNPHYMINGARYERRDHEAILRALSATAQDASVSNLFERVDHLIEMSSSTYATVSELTSGARQLAPPRDVMIVHDELRERFMMKASEMGAALGLSRDDAGRRLHLAMQAYLADGATSAGANSRAPLATYLEKSFGEIAVIDAYQIEALITDMRLAPVTHAKAAVDANNLSPRHVVGALIPADLSQDKIEAFLAIGVSNFAQYNPADTGSIAAAISEFKSGAYVESQASMATNRGAGGVAGVERIAREIQEQLPYAHITVCAKSSDIPGLPPELLNAGDRLNAVAGGGVIYLVAAGSGMTTESAVVAKIRHEAMHVGLRRLMPDAQYRNVMDRMWASMSKEDISRIASRYPHIDPRTAPGRRELAEEWLALRAETLPMERPGLLRRVALDIGLKGSGSFSQKEIDTLVVTAILSNGERRPWLDTTLGPDGFLVRTTGSIKTMGGESPVPKVANAFGSVSQDQSATAPSAPSPVRTEDMSMHPVRAANTIGAPALGTTPQPPDHGGMPKWLRKQGQEPDDQKRGGQPPSKSFDTSLDVGR